MGFSAILTLLFCSASPFAIMIFVALINDEEDKEEKRKKEELQAKRAIRKGPPDEDKYNEALRMYRNADPMICELLNRDKEEILRWVLNPKEWSIFADRDLYRLGLLFNYTIPELKRNDCSVYYGTPQFDRACREEDQRLEDWKRKLGISAIYSDPYGIIDPYEQIDAFKERGKKIVKRYGYWDGFKPNIFKTNERWFAKFN